MVKVPDLRNMSVQAARDILVEKGLEVDDSHITWILSDNVPKDLIISSEPTYDEEIEVGSKVKLTVSNGLYSTLYNYVGWDYKDARNELYALNFNVKVIPVESEETPGKILKQDPEAGFKYDPNIKNSITLEYSQEKIVILSYELKGMSIDQAVNFLSENKIKYSLEIKDRSYFSDSELDDTAADTVVRTEPELGSAINLSEDIIVKIYYYGE